MDFESNINNLATLLKSIIISESNDELSGSKPLMLYNEIEKIKSTDVGGDLEIVFRKVVDFIHLENTCSNHEKNVSLSLQNLQHHRMLIDSERKYSFYGLL